MNPVLSLEVNYSNPSNATPNATLPNSTSLIEHLNLYDEDPSISTVT